jgi:RNA polymerase sigma-70 factor (ECF subfamily)
MLAAKLAQRLGAAQLDELEGVLTDAVADATARWPNVAPNDERFVEAIASRVEGEVDLAPAVARLALPDIYLVAAALAGDRAALAAFERMVRDETTRAAARLPHAPAVEDVIQEMLLKLLVGPSPKLTAFAGHGALHAWLRVAAVRTAISMTRRKHEVSAPDDALAAVADDADDQALAFLKSTYRNEFKRAFAEALAEIPRRSRTLLRLQIIDQLTLEEIGAFYKVSRATAARWLADARVELVSGTKARLRESLKVSTGELDQLMKLVATNLYATLPSLLRITQTRGP